MSKFENLKQKVELLLISQDELSKTINEGMEELTPQERFELRNMMFEHVMNEIMKLDDEKEEEEAYHEDEVEEIPHLEERSDVIIITMDDEDQENAQVILAGLNAANSKTSEELTLEVLANADAVDGGEVGIAEVIDEYMYNHDLRLILTKFKSIK